MIFEIEKVNNGYIIKTGTFGNDGMFIADTDGTSVAHDNVDIGDTVIDLLKEEGE